MARTGRRIPVRIGATLETIEEHLKEQDREARSGQWIAFLVLGFSVLIVGVSLLLGKYFGYILLFDGVVMMLYAVVQARRIK